jgi:uncharacterized protein (DUF169 family)
MTNYAGLERQLVSVLHLSRRPVAVAFRDTPPDGVAALTGSQPSGCSFWRLAAGGRVFYTVPSDHFNCPIGSFTHNITLPEERQVELTRTLGLMIDIGYIKMQEIPDLPRLPKTPPVTIYAPLAETPVDADVVVVAGTPSNLMLLHEAALRAGMKALPMLGRPTCMAIPAALSGGIASSLGCIGNRVYTDVPDDQLYTVVSGRDLLAIAEELVTIVSANETLAEYHRGRRATLASA